MAYWIGDLVLSLLWLGYGMGSIIHQELLHAVGMAKRKKEKKKSSSYLYTCSEQSENKIQNSLDNSINNFSIFWVFEC